jgi:excisionase family DNA binding protein
MQFLLINYIGRTDLMEDMFTTYPDVVDVNQLNVMLGGNFSKKLLYRLLQNQEIKNRKVGREYRIPKKFVIEYLSK